MIYRVTNGQHVTVFCGTKEDFLRSYEREPATNEVWGHHTPDPNATYRYEDPNDKSTPRTITNDEAKKILRSYDNDQPSETDDALLAAMTEPGQYTNADEPWAARARITRTR